MRFIRKIGHKNSLCILDRQSTRTFLIKKDVVHLSTILRYRVDYSDMLSYKIYHMTTIGVYFYPFSYTTKIVAKEKMNH